MIENLKNLKYRVENFAQQHNIAKDNIYITVPINKNEIKSFDIIAKMFSQILGIPKERVDISFTHFPQNYPQYNEFQSLY